MTSTHSNKADPDVIANLYSGDDETVLKTISDLHFSGSVVYLPFLGDLLIKRQENTAVEVRKAIFSLLGELKDQESVPYLISFIDSEAWLPVRKELIASCWQNGLDYRDYLAKFVDWVIENEMDIAFEAFTVIENLEHFPADDIREAEIVKINHALRNADSLKSYLLKELRGILA